MHGMGAAHRFAQNHMIENGSSGEHQSPQQETEEEAVGARCRSRLRTEEALVPHLGGGGGRRKKRGRQSTLTHFLFAIAVVSDACGRKNIYMNRYLERRGYLGDNIPVCYV